MSNVLLVLAVVLPVVVVAVTLWLIRDTDPPKPPGRHRHPQEPLHGNDEPRPEDGDLP